MVLRRIVIALMAGTLLLSGCADESKPDSQATVPPSPTVSAVTESAAPEPEPEPEPETAKEFIRRWPLIETAMINSGETAEYLAFAEGCVPCSALAHRVESFYSRGGFAKTREPKVLAVRRVGGQKSLRFQVSLDEAPTTYRQSRKSPKRRLPGGQATYEISLERSDAAWRLSDVAELSTS